jgi:hypothetical protein
MKEKLKVVVDENTVLTVGKSYNVLCAQLRTYGKNYMYVPVIGIEHKDVQFSVNWDHVHVDGRFALDNHLLCIVDGKTNTIIDVSNSRNVRFPYVKYVVKKMKCLRLETGIIPPNPNYTNHLGERQGLKYWEWYGSMVGKSCRGKRCPHLGTKMLECNGVLVCPLHNLEGDIKTEKIITKKEVAIASEKIN